MQLGHSDAASKLGNFLNNGEMGISNKKIWMTWIASEMEICIMVTGSCTEGLLRLWCVSSGKSGKRENWCINQLQDGYKTALERVNGNSRMKTR